MFVIFIFSILIFGYFLLFIFALYTAYAMWKGAPFVPTSREHVAGMIRLAELKTSDIVMDIGSGDGRIVFAAAPLACRVIGIEINPLLYWLSRFRTSRLKQNNVTFLRQNLWGVPLSEVDVLMLFFIAPKMERLHEKIKREMKSGSRVISYGFRFPHWQYTKKDGKIYLYIIS